MNNNNFWGKNDRPYVIAEISQNHDGSLGQAHAFIDAVADMGVDAVKFQTHIASEESTTHEPFRVPFSYEDKTRYEYWKRMEFTEEQWEGLYHHAAERKIDFLSSPFSMKALNMLDKIGVPAWKFGSGEVFNEELLDAALTTGKPIILSIGLSTTDELRKQAGRVLKKGNELAILFCVTAYPSTADMIDIYEIQRLKREFENQAVIGISDHSATIYPALAAVTLGAEIVEVHVTLSKYMFGPDVKASVNLEQLKTIVEGSSYIDTMRKTAVDYSVRDSQRETLKEMFSKSLYFNRNMQQGEIIEKKDISLKKPHSENGIVNSNVVVGKTLKQAVFTDELVEETKLL